MESFDLLTAPSLYLIDVQIHTQRIGAGLVWAGPGLLDSAELFDGDRFICRVLIPDSMQQLDIPSLYFYPSETVDFLRP